MSVHATVDGMYVEVTWMAKVQAKSKAWPFDVPQARWLGVEGLWRALGLVCLFRR